MTEHRAVVLEPDPKCAQELGRILPELGLSATIAATEDEAIESIAAAPPHLAILDLNFGGELQGIGVALRINESFGVRSMFVTSDCNERILTSAAAADPLGYIFNPMHPRETEAAVRLVLMRLTREREREALLEGLGESEERLKVALSAARMGTWRWDIHSNTDILDANLSRLFALSPERQVKRIEDFYALVHPQDRRKVKHQFERTAVDGVHLNVEFRVVWPDGSVHWIVDQGEVFSDANGSRYLTGACMDITERKMAEEALRESEERFRLFVDCVRDYALIRLDGDGIVVGWNAGAERLLGYKEDEIIGASLARLFTAEDVLKGEPERERREAIANGRAEDERWHVRRDGVRFWSSGVLTPIREAGGTLRGFAKVMRDVTAQKQAGEQLHASLREKELLLKEIHHRVRNNLQVITSLLELQAGRVEDQSARAMFEEGANRVRAIAQIHRILYSSPDLARVDFDQYLRRMSADLMSLYGVADRLNIVIETGGALLAISEAIPCGLIANELLTNCFKHAFPGGRTGAIHLSLDCSEQTCSLAVSDDGVGIPEDALQQTSSSMGLQIVTVLVEQLEGTLEVNRTAGTRFTIHFPLSFNANDHERTL